jgi:hypothetical protein
MLDKDIVNLIKALVPRATQKQYIALAEYERTRSLDERVANAQFLDDLNLFFKEGMRQNSIDALKRQEKRIYTAERAEAKTKPKVEKYFSRPGIFPNLSEFICSNEFCGKKSTPRLAPKHKTPSGWKMWCLECGIPDEFRDLMKKYDKKYELYESWREENLRLGTHLVETEEENETEPETH